MKQIQKGFTLIELMIVVAIIGILAAVAIPAYQDYVVKSKLARVTSSLESIKTAIALYYQENGGFPADTTSKAVFGASPVATGPMWTSIGLTTVTLPQEIHEVDYAGQNDPTNGSNYGMALTLQNIRASTIDGRTILLSPVKGNTATDGGTSNSTITLASTGVSSGATSLPTIYSCTTSLDVIAKKYFNNSGVPC